MLTRDELSALENLLDRARRTARRDHQAAHDLIEPGDVVQLRPGADPAWEASLLIVQQTDSRHIRGPILRYHRSGCREAWARYSRAEVCRVGRVPFPEPPFDVRSTCYDPPCERMLRKPPAIAGRKSLTTRQAQAIYRDFDAAFRKARLEELRRCGGS